MAIKRLMIGILFYIISQAAIALTTTTDKFITLTDIHFDPFANCRMIAMHACSLIMALNITPATEWKKLFEDENNNNISGFGHDTDYALLKSSLAAIGSVDQNEKPRFVLVLGDFLAHHYHAQYIWYSHDHSNSGYQKFVKKTLEFLTTEMHKAIPNGDIYAIVGNNDSYTGDYGVVPDGEFLHDTAQTWSTLIKDKNNRKSFNATFPEGGYYVVDVPGTKKQKIIVLNTVLFSTAVTGPHVDKAAQTELGWLHAQLAQAARQHKSVLLAYHVPMGINIYAMLKNLFKGFNEFWQAKYNKAFKKELQAYSGTVKAILAGHIHIDAYQQITLNSDVEIPVSFTQAISPIFGNNPGFKIYSFNTDNLKLIFCDLYTHHINNQQDKNVWVKKSQSTVF